MTDRAPALDADDVADTLAGAVAARLRPKVGDDPELDVSDLGIVKVEGSRVIPLSAGASWLWFTVGDEGAEIIVHSYEPVAAQDHLRPDEDHVAVRADLRPGESRHWSLPPGHLVIAIRTDRNVAEGLGVDVEGATCGGIMTLVKGGFGCLSRAGASISVSRPATSRDGVVRVQVLLRLNRA
jgi:hypothetical protein